MTRQDFRAKWEAKREEWSRLQAIMPAGPLIGELLADLDAVDRHEGMELLTLTAAGERCGYSPDSLGRMIREGRLTNYGRPKAPRVRASDLPRKALRPRVVPRHFSDASRQVRMSVKTSGGK